MVLSEKHRSSIYRSLVPVLGDEEAQALMAHFPARDLDEPVTQEFVRAEIADVRSEIHDLRSEMYEGFGLLRTEMRDFVASQTRWTVGTIIGAGAIYTGMLGIIVTLS